MAGSVNKVILVGRLGQDPKLTYLPSGSPVAEFSLATDETYKNREGQKVEQTEWHRVKVYGKSAEFCGNYLGKGRLVFVEGCLRTRSWEDKDGQKRYITEVVISAPGHTIQFLDSKGSAQEAMSGAPGQDEPYRGAPPAKGKRPQREEEPGQAFPSESSGMDDVPF